MTARLTAQWMTAQAAGFASVLRQEWRAARARIVHTSVGIAAVMLGAAAVNICTYLTHATPLTFFCVVAYAAAMGCFVAVPFYALVRGAGNLYSVLFGESAPLMMLVPLPRAVILAGKQALNLAEYVIYAVPSFVYLLLMAPTGAFLFRAFFPDEHYHMGVYWQTLKEFFNNVFHVEWAATAHIALLCVASFAAAQATLNCAAAIYAAFVRGSKTQGKPSKVIMFVIIVLLFYLPVRVGTLGIERAHIDVPAFAYRAWPYMARLGVFAIAYFVLTAYLLERKVEVW